MRSMSKSYLREGLLWAVTIAVAFALLEGAKAISPWLAWAAGAVTLGVVFVRLVILARERK